MLSRGEHFVIRPCGRPSIQCRRACFYKPSVIFASVKASVVEPENPWRRQLISGSEIMMRCHFRCFGLEDHLSRKCDLAQLPPRLRLLSEMACQQPAISKMNKAQLLEECNRLGLVVHHKWTCEELKATIMEHRMNDPTAQRESALKSVSGMTLAELRTKADELGVMYTSKTTKGNLIRLIRDAVSTPGSELMKIGKYRGFEFQEIPRQYGMWAAREIRMSANPHVELVRFAKWWEAKEHEIHYGGDGSIEANATVPYPGDNTSTAGTSASTHWDLVQEAPTRWMGRDLPHDPRATKRGASSEEKDSMEPEIDPDTLDEIRALETRLAVLKQRAKAATAPPKAAP